ncbi:GNAT family N-acetyltransferase [Aequorivita sp. CIP111184]|uniref:GNAT family N-acetyltransferase n=1 Tax=Aequorivita sp. CIP111184 TaxID=2211356 RepID=UPI000DBC2771|nr:GNAT family N-acetyltransferase [Aequorivita sp. CIP111184]SRX54092.1 hypothetical protein AEQU1_01117 [Aequorivita sp. CIP111184]
MDLKIEDNKSKNQFETHVEGKVAIIAYEKDGNTLKLIHTEVPESLEGKGIASQMLKKVLTTISDSGYKVDPVCPFVKSYIEKHSEWQSLLKSK